MADSAAVRFSVQKLNGENYPVWSYKLQLMLIRDDLWSVIKDPTPILIDAAWRKKDDQARALIGLMVEDNQLMHIMAADTARAAWDTLKEYHQKATLTSKVHLLKRLCRLVLKESGDMEEHINTFSNYVTQLAALGQCLPDDLMAALLLGSLPESFDTLVTALESRPEADLTLQLVKSKLIDEYKRRKGARETKEDSCGSEAAMKVSHKEAKSCFFCKKTGHFKSECIKYKAWKKKQERANKVSENSPKREKETDECSFFASSSELFVEEKAFVSDEAECWFVDSGATSHMVNTPNFFNNLDPSRKGYVRLADNKLAEVKGIGKGAIKCIVKKDKVSQINIDDVLYVPKLASNLLSVRRLTKDGYRLIFEDDDCLITANNGEVRAIASLSPELYKVKLVERACTASEAIKSGHSEDCQHMWHRRFGHRDIGAIKDLAHKKLATGIIIKDCGKRETCECCVKGKMARTPFPKEAKNKAQSILDLVHTDVCGPMQTVTPAQKRYILTIIDDYSRYCTIYFMQYKSEAPKLIKQFVEMTKTQLGKKPKVIRSDRGREYVNDELQQYLKAEGIRMQYTTAYSPQQNGVAERKNRSLIEMARCMLLDADLDKKYWAEAANTANYLQNILPTKAANKTPYELWTSKKPDVKNLHIFGCKAYVFVHKEQRKKLDDKAEKMIFVGYSEESKGYRFLDKTTSRIRISRDVVFLDKAHEEKTPNNIMHSEIEFSFNNKQQEKDKEENVQQEIIELSEDESNEEYRSIDSDSSEDQQPESIPETQRRQSQRTNRGVPPDRYVATTKLAEEDHEPSSIQEALSGPDKEEWRKAINEELESLIRNGTWDVVPKPTGRDVITCKWVFKIKRNAEGDIERYKARLVARGFSQKYGVDYDEVFAPVVRQTTFRTLLTVASQKGMIIKHFDAKTAFLNGELEETIFMKLPEGYIGAGKKDLVCKLKKGIYGLKQAAKVWNDKINSLLKDYGFVQSTADPCLYVKNDKGDSIFLIIYVDDFLIAAKNIKKIDQTSDFLRGHFQLTDLGTLRHYLGIEIRRNSDGFFCLKQTKYIEKILCKFHLQNAKISTTPLDPGYVKIRDDKSPMPDNGMYQQLIGALLYLAVNTRPDIAASVAILSQHNKEPTTVDWNEVKRVARYLKGTKHYELCLGQQDMPKGLIGFADADWAENRTDRKSNSGYLFQYYGASISWSCRKQACVALSSTEAEYIALAEASQEAIWIRRLIEDFEQKKLEKTIIYEDNQSCLKLICNNKYSNRTKHIDTKFHYVKDLRVTGAVDYQYCPTEEMLADMLTKALGKIKLKSMAERSGLIS